MVYQAIHGLQQSLKCLPHFGKHVGRKIGHWGHHNVAQHFQALFGLRVLALAEPSMDGRALGTLHPFSLGQCPHLIDRHQLVALAVAVFVTIYNIVF